MHDDTGCFWMHIEALRAAKADPDKPEPFRRRLAERLKALDTMDLARFVGGMQLADAALDTQSLWWAASLLRGSICPGSEFREVRAWILGHGRIALASVGDDPDAIADWPLPTDKKGAPSPQLAPLFATPWKMLEPRVDFDPALQPSVYAETCPPGLPEDYGIDVGWRYWPAPTAQALAEALPRLWAQHGARWKDDPDPQIVREHPREADVAGLGRVRIGDTLVRRDGSAFTVLGLHDHDAFYAAFGMASTGGEPTIIARIREEDGTTRCNQGLGRSYQRWPHEPESVFPDDEPTAAVDEAHQAAWEAREDALQARVREALADQGEVRVRFSAYEEDADGLPVDNLDQRAHAGQIQIVETDQRDGERFESDVLTDPTWLDVLRVANRVILALDYQDHIYLEGLQVKRRARGKPALAKLVFGS
jgi:hypothetical protein